MDTNPETQRPFIAQINAQGDTMSDLMDAVREAAKRIENGNTSGFDSNDCGNFEFDATLGDE